MRDLLYLPDQYTGARLAKNADFTITRQVSSDRVFTNSRGWRVASSTDHNMSAKYVVCGCSWAMGVGSDYEQSIPAQLSSLLKEPVINLGVGSYSLLQTVRLLETEIDVIKPEKIIIVYGSWLVTRCLKEPESAMAYRPIFVEDIKSGFLKILPADNPPLCMIKHYKYVSEHIARSGLFFRKILKFYLNLIQKTGFLIHLRKRLVKRIFIGKFYNRLLSRDFVTRKKIIIYLLDSIKNIIEGKNIEVIFYHIYNFMHFDREEEDIRSDEMIFKNVLQNYSNIKYINWNCMYNKFKVFADSKKLDKKGLIHYASWSDNNHPNPIGYRLIAENMYESLNKEL